MKSSLTGSFLLLGFLYNRYINVQNGTIGYKMNKIRAYKTTLYQIYFALYIDKKFMEAARPGTQFMDKDMTPYMNLSGVEIKL